MHHPAAALSTTCGADGGPLTLSLSCDPSPSHPPYSLPSSRAPTRGSSANQSAFSPSRTQLPVSGPETGPCGPVGLSTWPGGGAGTTSVRTITLSRAGLDRRVHAFARGASVGRRSMASAIESDSEHDRGASRTPTTVRTVARLHRSTPDCPPKRARLSVGGPPPCGASQSDLDGTGAGVHAADRHACDCSPTRLYPDPRGPDTSCHDAAVSRVSAREGPSTSPGNPPLPASSRGPLRLPSREGKPTPPARGAFRPGILREEQRDVV